MRITFLNHPGMGKAIRELFCGHLIDTESTLYVFRTHKGELTECPHGCGFQKTRHVRNASNIKEQS